MIETQETERHSHNPLVRYFKLLGPGLVTAAPTLAFVPLFGAGIMLVTVYTSYATFAKYLKWMTAVLFAYVVAAVLAHPDWWEAWAATVVPSLRWDAAYVATLAGVLGTTVSP